MIFQNTLFSSKEGGLDVILRDQNSMLELATYFQRGLHSGLDIISDPDVMPVSYTHLLGITLDEVKKSKGVIQ